mmetsp:Transcript_65735/g.189169  ORF Transcript_65735/g.189169 Transcript_65735/m.189169 type:complete len:258 (+) Transcript_65735:332-1105(+)
MAAATLCRPDIQPLRPKPAPEARLETRRRASPPMAPEPLQWPLGGPPRPLGSPAEPGAAQPAQSPAVAESATQVLASSPSAAPRPTQQQGRRWPDGCAAEADSPPTRAPTATLRRPPQASPRRGGHRRRPRTRRRPKRRPLPRLRLNPRRRWCRPSLRPQPHRHRRLRLLQILRHRWSWRLHPRTRRRLCPSLRPRLRRHLRLCLLLRLRRRCLPLPLHRCLLLPPLTLCRRQPQQKSTEVAVEDSMSAVALPRRHL